VYTRCWQLPCSALCSDTTLVTSVTVTVTLRGRLGKWALRVLGIGTSTVRHGTPK
jgi:hypothetical protein